MKRLSLKQGLYLLLPLVLGACASKQVQPLMDLPGPLSRTYTIEGHINSPYPDYVSLVRLPDVNTTSMVITLD